MAKIIDGRLIAKILKENIKVEVQHLHEKGITPQLAVIRVGDDPASGVYIANKLHACHSVGIKASVHHLKSTVAESDLETLIQSLNTDSSVHGILLQLPLPASFQASHFLSLIDPLKDVDGLCPLNVGYLAMSQPKILPCTPQGCIHLIKTVEPSLVGKKVLLTGCSQLVGRPLLQLLLMEGATVTVTHSLTKNLKAECESAEIAVIAIGQPAFIKGEWFRKGAILIDVGINRVQDLESFSIVGDVDPTSKLDHLKAYTPVPGGVGPMTIAYLLSNILKAVHLQTE